MLSKTGVITSIISFFSRIYLLRLIGEEGIGIYQLLNPDVSLSCPLIAAGSQASISKYDAVHSAGRRSDDWRPLMTGASITLRLSLGLCAVLFLALQPIGTVLLNDVGTISMLRSLSYSNPYAVLHACLIGDLYSQTIASVAILTQLHVPLASVGYVFLGT